jgi:Ser/Thr protein kinase RdoA (MazF antagonist)
MESFLQSTLAPAYAFAPIVSSTVLGGTRNDNYRVETETVTWFVRRRYAGYSEPSRVAFDHNAIRYLAEHKAPVLLPQRTGNGATWLMDGDRAWEVFPFQGGTHPEEGNTAHAAAIGDALGKFHAAGSGFSERYSKLGPRGETDPLELLDIAARIDRESEDCTAILRSYRTWVVVATEALPARRFAALPHVLVHGDIQPANILMKDAAVAAFVDLDWCAWRPRIYDLAFAMLFCCSTHETAIDGSDIWSLTQPLRLHETLVRAFLNSYERRTEPIGAGERDALVGQAMLAWCHCRLAGALKVSPHKRHGFLARPPDDATMLVPSLD